jgi:hypothetical protein
MITEDYVSFETAKLLKEKGFECANLHYYYDEDGDLLFSAWNIGAGKNRLVAPTLQMAMKWLRKEHGLHCHSDYDIVLGWYCQITSLTETVEYDYEEMKHYHPDKDNGFSSPEEACEEAIRYCLKNLI